MKFYVSTIPQSFLRFGCLLKRDNLVLHRLWWWITHSNHLYLSHSRSLLPWQRVPCWFLGIEPTSLDLDSQSGVFDFSAMVNPIRWKIYLILIIIVVVFILICIGNHITDNIERKNCKCQQVIRVEAKLAFSSWTFDVLQ